MICIHVYVGLPGSGKTFHAKKDLSKMGGILLDDPQDPKLIKKNILDSIGSVKYIFITDPNLCSPKNRKNFEKFIELISDKINIEYHFFENDINKCWNNIKYRNDSRKISKEGLSSFSRNYKIPKGAKQIKIWERNIKC